MILLELIENEIVIINPNEVACMKTTHRVNDYIITIVFKSGELKAFTFYNKKQFDTAVNRLIEKLTPSESYRSNLDNNN